jgi:hypothetical protein
MVPLQQQMAQMVQAQHLAWSQRLQLAVVVAMVLAPTEMLVALEVEVEMMAQQAVLEHQDKDLLVVMAQQVRLIQVLVVVEQVRLDKTLKRLQAEQAALEQRQALVVHL